MERTGTVVLLGLTILVINSASATTVTFSDTGNAGLQAGSGLIYSASGGSSTAGYVAGSPGYADLNTTPNSSSDTAMVTIQNGYEGVSLGNLNYLLSQGAAGNVTFDLSRMTGAFDGTYFNFAYWVVTLVDPNNGANTISINAYSDNKLNGNSFNQGESVQASVSTPNIGLVFGTYWTGGGTTVAGTLDDGTALGSWNVASVSIEIGGWPNATAGEAQIDSIILPGGSVPDGCSTAVLLGIGFVGLALFVRQPVRVFGLKKGTLALRSIPAETCRKNAFYHLTRKADFSMCAAGFRESLLEEKNLW